ncbi:MAG: fused MFS/spermidine synthase, partial [Azonexaceae bacterium]|nr:fused MFS/spermidine synthase [Azonexaceae bacterium]
EDFPECRVLTIPALQFAVDWDMPWTITAKGWQDVHRRLSEKVKRYVEVVEGAGLRLAFEILPFSVFGGISRFLAISKEIGSPALGLNFDTGHGWACRELLPSLPFELEGRIFGLHLGDNLSTENVKMAPGKGTIPWKPLLKSLVNEAGIPQKNITVFEEDGRVFVRRAIKKGYKYDLVLLDAFDHEYIPEHLLTREFLEDVKKTILPGGVLAANTWATSRLYAHESVTYQSVFGEFFNLKYISRVILTKQDGLPSMEVIKKNSDALDDKLKRFGVEASWLLPLFSTRRDWRTGD